MTTGDRSDALLEDILAGPAELAAVLQAQGRVLPDLPLGALARPTWRLVGMGSSRFAAMDAAARLRAAGRDAHAEYASASGASPGGQDTTVVAISASGRTPEVLMRAEHHHGSSFVLGLTARGDSPLAASADAVLPLAATYLETAGIATLTYRATVAALAALAGLTGDLDPDAVRRSLTASGPALKELLDGRDTWLGDATAVLDGGRPIHVLGDGLRMGACEQAALVLREAPRIAASAFETGDWLHVGLYSLFPGDPVLLLAGSPFDEEVIATVHARGGRVVMVAPERGSADVNVTLPAPARDAVVRAIVEPAVADLLAAGLWCRTNASAVVGGATG